MLLDVITKGTTDYSCTVRIVDSSDGTPETAVVYNTSGIDLWYRRPGSAHSSITEATQTEGGAHSDGGFVHVSDGNYRLDLPDAAVASGADYVDVGGTVTGMVVIGGRIRLIDADLDDSVRMGMTALPNAAADAAGGLPISDAGGLDLDAMNTNINDIETDTNELQGDWADGGRLDLILDSILDDTGTSGVLLASGATSAQLVDDVWDEATSGHASAGSFGAALPVIRSNTAQAGAATTITLDASASATDDWYNDQHIFILSGTGAGQGRFITDYNGTTKVATVATWATNPSSDSVFVITPFGSVAGASAPTAAQVADAVWDEAMADHQAEGSFGTMLQAFHQGTAQAGAAGSITLDATGSSSTDDFYNYSEIEIVAGTGAGQSRQISDYNGTSKVATVSLNWTTNPSTDSEYVIRHLGIDAATIAQIADGVWDEARSGHVTAGTFGEHVNSDLVKISGDSSAADNLEADYDGDGYNKSNSTIGTVTTLTGHTVQTGDSFARLGAPAGASIAADIATVDGVADSILTDTGTTLPALIGTPAGADLVADVAGVQTTADAIETDTQDIQSRLPAALVSGRMSSDAVAISGDTITADVLQLSVGVGVVTGAAITGTLTTTAMTTDLTEATDDHYIGRTVIWTSGALLGQASNITDYNGTTKLVTYSTVTEAPSNTDSFIIV